VAARNCLQKRVYFCFWGQFFAGVKPAGCRQLMKIMKITGQPVLTTQANYRNKFVIFIKTRLSSAAMLWLNQQIALTNHWRRGLSARGKLARLGSFAGIQWRLTRPLPFCYFPSCRFYGKLSPMMMPLGSPGKQQRRQCQPAGSLMGWQRLLLGCYSALFALVLPLICWGALAEPGHAHRYPHFVFADPVHARLPTGDASAVGLREWLWGQLRVEPHVQHHPLVENAANQKHASSVCDMDPADAIAGRATPTLMLFPFCC
jgi:hypothetical protein